MVNEIFKFEQYNTRIAMYDDRGNSVSYEELDTCGNVIAEVIGRRSLVFCLCRNEIGSIAGYVSFINHRIIPVLLNSNIANELLCDLLEIYKPQYMWLPKDMIGIFHSECVYEIFDYCLLKMSNSVNVLYYQELALLLTTSGSTGSPKFVRQSYKNIISNAESIADYLHLNADEKPITTLPMNYTYGLSIINSHLIVGATLLVTDKGIMQKTFWEFFKERGATSFGGVPYTYEMLDKLHFERMGLESLRTMTQAGGKLTPELHEKFATYAHENKKDFVVMYGQCEATARMGYLPPEMALSKIGSMGIAIPGGEFMLINDKGQEIKTAYTPGELVYRGDNVTLGYAECLEDLCKDDERKGVLETGDIAQFDDEGFYYIVGRKKRFLKIYGNRVNLDEIDRLIKGKFKIDVATTGIDDHMYIFITENLNISIILEYLVNITKLNVKAFKVLVIDEIPKNDSGKILYKELNNYIV